MAEAERRYIDACHAEAEAWWASHQSPSDHDLIVRWQMAFFEMSAAISRLMALLDEK